MSSTSPRPFYIRWWTWSIAIIVLVIVGLLVFRNNVKALGGENMPSTVTDDSMETATQVFNRQEQYRYEKNDDLDVSDVKDSTDTDGRHFLTGNVRSKTETPYQFVELNFTLHDRSGAITQVLTVNTTALEAGRTWRFVGEMPPREISSFKFVRSSAW